jgi:uncharacterized protein
MDKSNSVLITGASGLIGTRLTQLLMEKGYIVSHLGRSSGNSSIPSFRWDIKKQIADAEAFKKIDTIIHLAGAGVAERRWTEQRKKEIIDSRTMSTQLVFNTLKKIDNSVKNFICASGTGYYGTEQTDYVNETSPAGSDFLAKVTKRWEEEADKFSSLGIRVVKMRIGIVLSDKGGALAELAKPIRYFVGAPLGSGKQYLSWIHIDDLCELFIKAISDQSMNGAYNAVAPQPVTNREITKAIAKELNRPLILPAVPGFALRMILGEMAEMVLTGSKVSGEKIQKTGYKFKYPSLDNALRNLLSKS